MAILKYSIAYVTATLELVACNNGDTILNVDQRFTTVVYDTYDLLIQGMDQIGIDYSGWRRVWIKES